MAASIAETMAHLSLEPGISTKQDGATALFRTIQGLVTSLVSSLEDFQDVGASLELEVAAGSIVTNSNPDVRPELLVVAATVKEMVGTWVSALKAKSQLVEELLPAVHHKSSGADHQDLIVSKPPESCSVAESAPVCISSKDLEVPERGSVQGQVICQHSCEHHPELVDRWLWRKLPQEMVELVFAHLPLPQIIELCKCSEAWSVLSKSSNFLDFCSERYPKLVGLSVWDVHSESMGTTVYDIKSREWLTVELGGLPRSCFRHDESYDYLGIHLYEKAMYACNGGLVCFVPQELSTGTPVLVCNPLTNVWKSLPWSSYFPEGNIVLVQLTMEDDLKGYKVMLVVWEWASATPAFSAYCYSSQSGVWNTMDSGLVYGTSRRLEALDSGGYFVHYVFDCATKVLHNLRECVSFPRGYVLTYSMFKDHLFVLHQVNSKLFISELIWNSSASDLRELNIFESNFPSSNHPYVDRLFASCGFVLLITDNCAVWHEDRGQVIEFHDLSANHRHIPPALGKGNIFKAGEVLVMSELRWDISP